MGNRYNKETHLEFIQNAITRMATNSFILKGWSVTLTSGIIAFSLSQKTNIYVALAFIPAAMFWGLDAYYFRQERLFRKLYDHVRLSNIKRETHYSLDNKEFSNSENGFCTLFSKSVFWLHSSLFIIILMVIILGGK